MKIILLGYMASGKSTIGKKMAKELQMTFIDLDDYIVKQENLSIIEIFKSKGEIYFRKKETIYLEELMNNNEKFILALGGGTPCYGNNMEIINKIGISFYLKYSLQNIYDRLSRVKNKITRPLISNISTDKLKEFIAKHLFERSPFYEKAKHIIISDNKTKKEIAKEILGLIN